VTKVLHTYVSNSISIPPIYEVLFDCCRKCAQKLAIGNGLADITMAQNVKIPEVLRCLLTPDAETGRWLGHCLELDVVTSGKDPDAAWKNLKAVVRLHVEHCFTNWQEGLLNFRASDEEIAVFEALKGRQLFRSDKITFTLIPPQKNELHPLWMQGVELTEGVGSVRTPCTPIQ
jgi:predicted RNase H-like HicB family nuclease